MDTAFFTSLAEVQHMIGVEEAAKSITTLVRDGVMAGALFLNFQPPIDKTPKVATPIEVDCES
jgi:uncharacterized membrane protein